jgi:hypothetical protein
MVLEFMHIPIHEIERECKKKDRTNAGQADEAGVVCLVSE